METREQKIEYCENMGRTIEQMDSELFIDEYLVGEPFRIYKDNGLLCIDLLSGVNYYGELSATIEVHPDNSFRVERYGENVGPFYSDDLYNGLSDALYDIIEQ